MFSGSRMSVKVKKIASILIVLMFILSGVFKFMDIDMEASRLDAKLQNNFGIDDPLGGNGIVLIILIAGIWELLGSLMILYGTFHDNLPFLSKDSFSSAVTIGKYGCVSLIIFTMIVTLIFHFPPNTPGKYYPFISNVNTVGGLMLLSNSF